MIKKNIKIGDCLIVNNIANLITKHYVNEKPTYNNLLISLLNLKKYCENNNIKTLIMPKIGCGLDKLNWNKVKNLLYDNFNNYKIIVCYI